MMKAEDLKGKSADELKKTLVELRKKQFNQRFEHSGGQLAKTHEIRGIRRDIARVKTFLNQVKQQETKKPAKTKKAA